MSLAPSQSNQKLTELKISKVLLALCTKTLTKIFKTRKADFSGRQLSQVASNNLEGTCYTSKISWGHI